MVDLTFLLSSPPSLRAPSGLIGWMGWLFFLGMAVLLAVRGREYQRPWTSRTIGIVLGLLLLVPVTSLLLPAIQVGHANQSTQIGLTPAMDQVPLLLLAAVPWFLAAGLVGSGPAAVLAAASGFLIVAWSTHNIFLPVELAAIGGGLGLALRQPYRTLFFKALRHPLFSAVLFAAAYPVIYLLESVFLAQGILIARLGDPAGYLMPAWLAITGNFFIAGLISEAFRLLFPGWWVEAHPLKPSPPERQLRSRFLYGLVPLMGFLIILLVLAAWVVASRASRQMLEGRMQSAADMSAQSMPFYLETGQNLLARLAEDPRLFQPGSSEAIQQVLDRNLSEIPFFNQLVLFNAEGQPVAGSPQSDLESLSFSPDELAGLEMARNIPQQIHSVQPKPGDPAATISFISAVKDDSGGYQGALIARSDLATNPLAKPLLASLNSLGQVGGEGMLLDESGRVLYHPDASRIMSTFPLEKGSGPIYYGEQAADGSRWLVYYQPVGGRPWSVVIRVPMQYAQEQAMAIVAPLLGVFFLFSLLAIGFLLVGLRAVTQSIQRLAIQADRMSHGHLDEPLEVHGEDEIGQLSQAFEQMRSSLKARLDELNRLLLVSQKATASLEIEDALNPVLESALVIGATAARISLVPELFADRGGVAPGSLSFGAGPAAESYRYLDEQIMPLSRQQDRVQIANLTRPRLLALSPDAPHPQSLLALALREENIYYGTLWIGFSQPHHFQDEEIRYLTTLAGQAALAAANVRLFQTAELGRQRLEAILASTPDPVLVTDHQERLLLTNPAADQVLGFGEQGGKGQRIGVIQIEELVNLLRSSANGRQSAELTLSDGRIYLATASAIMSEDQRMGRVCVMRDITHLKEIDSLKSEFVSTVSHDLRSPLTLIQGYASILQMVGELNEQQSNYIGKIITSVEGMSRLVNNLLDLGRIEAGIGLQLQLQPAQSVVENVVDALQVQAVQKRVLLTCDLPDQELPQIEADHALLQQALYNLVENAIKFTEVGGKVIVGLIVDSVRVVYFVQDNGVGIAPADQQRLFEKFYQSNSGGKKGGRSSGLGLAIVRSIAERHKGQVWVDSQLGKGSTLYLAIPLRQTQPNL
jgi:PAS domain S-box-containing protein